MECTNLNVKRKKCWVPINIHMLIYGHIGILHDRNKRNKYAYIQLWHMISMQMQQANDIVPYEYVIFIHNKKSGKKCLPLWIYSTHKELQIKKTQNIKTKHRRELGRKRWALNMDEWIAKKQIYFIILVRIRCLNLGRDEISTKVTE